MNYSSFIDEAYEAMCFSWQFGIFVDYYYSSDLTVEDGQRTFYECVTGQRTFYDRVAHIDHKLCVIIFTALCRLFFVAIWHFCRLLLFF